ncbi:MAG TPA: hypothetical protein VFM34_13265 [Moraxellaceae bacterium]|nr:hypothetical protein [Moraxellaceae bacterium]
MRAGAESFRRDAERMRLARLLACDPEELRFLDTLDAGELRLLRLATKEWLGRAMRPLLLRAIQASTLLPSALVASIGRETLGPLLSARFSDYMNRSQLVSISRHHPAAFLAEVGLHLDIDKLSELAVAMPPDILRAVVREVLARKEYIMLGELLDRLPPTRLPHVARELTEGEPYLRTMFFVESPARRQEIVEMLPEGVLYDSMRAVARSPEALLPMALSLTLEVSPAWQRRMAVHALENGDSLLGDLVAGIVRLDMWRVALPLMERLSPQEIGRLMHLPVWRDATVLDALLKGGASPPLRPWLEALLDQMPPELATMARQRLAEHSS